MPEPSPDPAAATTVAPPARHGAALIVCLCCLGAVVASPADRDGPTENANGEREDQDRWRDLLAALGDRDWMRREEAQAQLIELGPAAIPYLVEAARSVDPEVALRARYVLDRVDPVRHRFRVVRVGLDDGPAVIEVIDGEGAEGEEVELAAEGAAGGMRYFVRTRRLIDGRFAVTVEKGRSGVAASSYRTTLAEPNGAAGTLSVLERGSEAFYMQLGIRTEREHHAFVTLFAHDRRRLSAWRGDDGADSASSAVFSQEGERLLSALLERLRRQLEADEPRARDGAAEIVGLLGDRQSIPLLRQLAGDSRPGRPAVFALARLGDPAALDELGTLLEAGNAGEIGEDPAARAGLLATEAAFVLAERGDASAVEHLIAQLAEADPTVAGRIVAALAGEIPFTQPALNRLVLGKLADRDTIQQIPWSNPETEYLYERAVGLLSRDEPEHAALAAGMLAAFAEKFSEADPVSRTELTAFLSLWERIAVVFPFVDLSDDTAAIRAVAVDLLAGLKDQSQIPVVFEWLARMHEFGPLPEPLFRELRAEIERRLEQGEPGGESSAMALLVHLVKSFTPTEQQLGPVVELLLAASGGSHPSYQSQILDEIVRLSGVGGAPDKGGDDHARATRGTRAGGTARNARLRAESLRPEVERWLSDPAAVEAAWRRLVEPGAVAGDPGQQPEVELVEIELLLRPDDGDPAAGDGRRVEILDGRVVRLPLAKTVSVRDRFGNLRGVRVDRLAFPASALRGPVAVPTRYRLGDGAFVTEGIPLLTVPRQRNLRAARYVVTDSQLGPYRESASSGPQLKSVVYVRGIADVEAPEGLLPVRSGAEAWDHLMARVGESLETSSSDAAIRGIIRLVKELGAKELIPNLRSRFARSPTILLAGELIDLGEDAAIVYLGERLGSENRQEATLAARSLAEHGDREGLRFLLDLLRRGERSVGTSYSSILRSIDRFLVDGSPTVSEKEEVLEILFDNLDSSTFQSAAFTVLKREAGTDFGYIAAQQSRNHRDRSALRAKAVERARAWWRSRKGD